MMKLLIWRRLGIKDQRDVVFVTLLVYLLDLGLKVPIKHQKLFLTQFQYLIRNLSLLLKPDLE